MASGYGSIAKLSRDKGKRGELEVDKALDAAGLEHIREQDGRTQGADFLIERTIMLDAKRRERIQIVDWSEEVEGKAPNHLVPAIAYRKNNQPWRVSLLLTDWLELVKAAQG